jgi:hypothetical protein
MVQDMGVELLGRLPLDPALARAAEQGLPLGAPLQAPPQQHGAPAPLALQPQAGPAFAAMVARLVALLEQVPQQQHHQQGMATET